jgi:hypothetical protein
MAAGGNVRGRLPAFRLSGAYRRWAVRLAVVLLAFLLPVGASLVGRAVSPANAANWWDARRDSAGLAPDAAGTPEAVLQVYAARAYGWRGAFGVHTWFAVKPAGAAHYERLEVIGWYVYRGGGGSAVRVSPGTPDAYWFGNAPELLVDLRGPGVDEVIGKVRAAARDYPWRDRYRVWPGPNSNTFTAWVARQVPELRLDLPPHAVGKDYLGGTAFVADSPSGTGKQVSLMGLAGILVGREEGVEINLLGLTMGVDFSPFALKLPGVGRVGKEK